MRRQPFRRRRSRSRLCFAAFFRRVTIGNHRGCADEAKIPPDAEQDQRDPEMREIKARERNDCRQANNQQAHSGHAFLAETGDQHAGEEAWRKHCQHMPLEPSAA